MTAVILAALSGLSYGASDFSGAMASKDNDATVVTVAVQMVSLAVLAVFLVFSTAQPTTADLAWGALAGVGGGIGLSTFYRALAIGPMSTAAALTALISAAVPVLTGLLLGDRPPAITLLGVALAVPAGVLVSVGSTGVHGVLRAGPPRERVVAGRRTRQTRGLSVVAGLGFSLFYIALSRTSEDAGAVAPVGCPRGLGPRPRPGDRGPPLVPADRPRGLRCGDHRRGVLDFAANGLYLEALRHGTFTWVAAISSLYPVSTVMLARVVLGERLGRVQVAGLGMAGAAMVLVAVGV